MSAPGADVVAPALWRRRFTPGLVLAGKYQIERVLAETELALVVEAIRKDLDQLVTLRILLPELSSREAVAARYLREARRIAGLRSDHALRIVDVLRLPSSEPVVVTERLEGNPLSATLGDVPPMPLIRATELLAQACDAVAEAHERGWVHGELNPRNLFLARRSRGAPIVKVLELGVAAIRGEIERSDGSVTPHRIVRGEPIYLAPEQIDPAKVPDTRSDVWALGAILFELVTGRAPFAADNIAEVLRLVGEGDVGPPSALRPGIPQAIDDVVACCLQKDPDRRYTHAGELLAALEDAVSDRSQTAVRRIPSPSAESEDERDSATEVRPFVPDEDDLNRPPAAVVEPVPPSAPPSEGRGKALAVSAPAIGDSSAFIPSLVTGSVPSSGGLNVRPHPLPEIVPSAADNPRVVLFVLLLASIAVAILIVVAVLVL